MARVPGERRRHKRYRIDLKSNFAVTRLRKALEGECIIRDISYGGSGLIIDKKLNRRTYLLVPIVLENLDIDTTAGGKIIWLKRHNSTPSCGIKFDWFSDKDAYARYMQMLEVANSIY